MPDWPPDPALQPQIDAVFAFVQPSYDVMARRMDAVSTRLSQLSTVVSAVTFGAFALAAQAIEKPAFGSCWTAAALSLALAALLVGWGVQFWSNELIVLDPGKLAATEVTRYASVEELRAGMLYFAGEHFEMNRVRIERMWFASLVMTVLLTAELLCIAAWAVPQL